jgi:uncharacterized protein YqgV (UPF0045/DUF77 family)
MQPLEKVVSCEISFIPIQSRDYIKDVDRVLDLIKESGLAHTIGSMSTCIHGGKTEIFNLLEKIYTAMEDICLFKINVGLSNICGCKS